MIIKNFRKLRKKTTLESQVFQSAKDYIDHIRTSPGGWGGLYYGNVSTLAKMVRAQKLVEIGVAQGLHAETILAECPDVCYTGIDPYIYGYDEKDVFCQDVEAALGLQGQLAMDALYEQVSENLDKYGDRAKLYRETSELALKRDELKGIDVVFLDGDHRYEAVKSELEAWWPRVATGGVLAGDDYWMPQVAQAFKEFSSESGVPLRFISKNDYLTVFVHKDKS